MRMGWNALTLVNADGAFFDSASGEAVLDIFHARDFRKPGWQHIGSVIPVDDVAAAYFDRMEEFLDVAAIKRANLTVAIDTVNGAGSRFLKPFAARLGFKLVAVNAEESGFMAHDPEPRPRNARQVASILPLVGAQVGFVTSSDCSRVSIVADDAETASEEYTFPLVADHLLRRTPGVVVSNCCTTRMVDDVAAAHKCPVVKTPVGQAYIMAKLADENGVIGGEGNGSVAVPSFSRACDGLLTIGLILESLAQRPAKISARLHELTRYHIVKRMVYGEPRRCYRALEALQADPSWATDAPRDETDGLRADWNDGWLHVRASQTEPMIRIISESCSRPLAEERAMATVRTLEREL
jgi:phosphomannomutase